MIIKRRRENISLGSVETKNGGKNKLVPEFSRIKHKSFVIGNLKKKQLHFSPPRYQLSCLYSRVSETDVGEYSTIFFLQHKKKFIESGKFIITLNILENPIKCYNLF